MAARSRARTNRHKDRRAQSRPTRSPVGARRLRQGRLRLRCPANIARHDCLSPDRWSHPLNRVSCMCLGLAELREAVAVYAAGFDPMVLSGTDAARVMADAAGVQDVGAPVEA